VDRGRGSDFLNVVEVVLKGEAEHVWLLQALELALPWREQLPEGLFVIEGNLRVHKSPVLRVRVIVGALEAFEAFLLLTWLSLIEQGVKLLLLPSVTVRTGLQPLAALFVARDKGSALPVFTKLDFVLEEVGATAEILEIVGVDALGLVVIMVEGAPLCFEVKLVKVEVLLAGLREQVMDQAHLDVLDRVSEGTILSVLALGNFAGEKVAKFGFVFVLVVEALDTVVRAAALVSLGTLFSFGELAKLGRVDIVVSTAVLQ